MKSKFDKLVAKLKHNWNVVHFESSPFVSANLKGTGLETIKIFKRTFACRRSLSVAELLQLEVTMETKQSDFEKHIDTLFHTHDYDGSKSINLAEFNHLADDFYLIASKGKCISD